MLAATLLLEGFMAHAWVPTAGERALAEDLARAGLTASTLRAGLREAPPGRLAAALEPVTVAMESTLPTLEAKELRVLSQLLDRIAAPPL